jgi:hypothetical protein
MLWNQLHPIHLDGESHEIKQPRAFQLFQGIYENREPITRKELRDKIKGLQGDKTIPNLLKTLPKPLQEIVKSGTRLGYWIVLPSLRKKKKKSAIRR